MRAPLFVVAVGVALACSAPPTFATFPGRDGEIAYTRTDRFRNQTVWSVDPRTGRERQLTRVPAQCRRVRAGWLDDVPVHSASGRRIFYGHSGDCARRNNPFGLYRLPARGGTPRLVVRDRGLRATWWPVPLAGGKRLLYSNDLSISRRFDRDGFSNTIFSAPLGGRNIFRRLSPRGETSDEFPAVSASGRVAFARGHRRLLLGSARRRLSDGNLRVLAAYRGWSVSTPDFSPDGRRIVFARDRHRRRSFDSAIYVVGVRGRGLRRLAHAREPVSPVWSPSGRRIAFVRAPDDSAPHQGPLYVMDRNGRRARKLLDGVDDTRLSWQPLR